MTAVMEEPTKLQVGAWSMAEEGSTTTLLKDGWANLAVESRRALGRERRSRTPREAQAYFEPAADRADPVAVLQAEAANRQRDLVPLRYGRMAESPFTFYRAGATIMAGDLAKTPTSGIQVQLCGDCHLSNFGLYASPERTLMFDLNDFDETLPGPWEWDVKRLAASFAIACRQIPGLSGIEAESAARVAGAYRTRMAEFAEMGDLDVWYSHVDAAEIMSQLTSARMRRSAGKIIRKAQSKDRLAAFSKLTHLVNGQRQFVNQPPTLIRLEAPDMAERAQHQLAAYRRTLSHERRYLLEQYQPVDLARKVVGVGSVGTRCMVALLQGRDDGDPLFLQIKEAGPSALESYLPRSKFRNHGQRVVAGQRQMQASSDIFLGWIRAADGRDYYFRQLQDMKGSVDTETAQPAGALAYAGWCGWVLARAHARSGDRIQLASYLGKRTRFDQAIARFASRYADQNERDYEALLKAIKTGKVQAKND
jgi:uncharacterized protein (DUF2252 family)